MNRKVKLIFALALFCPLAASADNRIASNQDDATRARQGDVKEKELYQNMIDRSAEVYSAIAKGPQGEVPSRVVNSAQCIVVFPNAMTGAIVVGGTHGNGVASCKNGENKWSQPAAVSLNQGSIGLQAGVKSAEIVMYLQSNDAVTALKRGNFELGSDVSAVAGNYDSSVDTSRAGVVVYTRAEGAFAGAAVSGGKISVNDEDLASFYGKKVDRIALLENRESPDSTGYSNKFTKILP